MKTAIILHGMPGKEMYLNSEEPPESKKHWIPWLQKQLIIAGYNCQTPELPRPYEPDYSEWQKEFEKHPITSESLLVGHSCGASFLLRYLSENEIQVTKVLLIAPWVDPEKKSTTRFCDFSLDPKLGIKNEVTLFSSSNDGKSIKDSVLLIRKKCPEVVVREFKKYGHFCYQDMKTELFPEAVDFLV